MSEIFVMRRANGDLFAKRFDDKRRIPVWSNKEAAARYKARNPDLMIFWPVRLDHQLMKKIMKDLNSDIATEFFLLSEDAPDADLEDGRPITPGEILPTGEIASRPARLKV